MQPILPELALPRVAPLRARTWSMWTNLTASTEMARALSALLVSFVAYATPASASIALHAYRKCSSVVKIWGFATGLPANRQVHAYFVLDTLYGGEHDWEILGDSYLFTSATGSLSTPNSYTSLTTHHRKDRLTFNVSYSTLYRTSAAAPIC